MSSFKCRPVQTRLRFYEDDKINKSCKPGDIILLNKTKNVKKQLIESVVPHLVVKESDFRDKELKNCDYIIKTERANDKRRSFNYYIDNNKLGWPIFFTVLERAKNPKIGDKLVKIEKFRLRYRVVEVVYDGVMNTRDFFIMVKNK